MKCTKCGLENSRHSKSFRKCGNYWRRKIRLFTNLQTGRSSRNL